jgi:hypothetical protein
MEVMKVCKRSLLVFCILPTNVYLGLNRLRHLPNPALLWIFGETRDVGVASAIGWIDEIRSDKHSLLVDQPLLAGPFLGGAARMHRGLSTHLRLDRIITVQYLCQAKRAKGGVQSCILACASRG